MQTIALAHTSAAAVAAAGGGWVARVADEYERLAERLARKSAGKMVKGGGGCTSRKKTMAVVRMVQVTASDIDECCGADGDPGGGGGGAWGTGGGG